MNLNLYTAKGDPQELLRIWDSFLDEIGREELFLHVVTTNNEGITLVDVCPTEADFQGWINGDDWRRISAQLGEVTVTRLGEVRSAVARDTVVDLVHHAHA